MASARKGPTAADATTQPLEVMWATSPTVPTGTETVAPALEARWTAVPPGYAGEGLDTRPAVVLEQERSEQQPATRRGVQRRSRKRGGTKAEPDLYPSQQGAWACGLFI
jgi:hypothetical protein